MSKTSLKLTQLLASQTSGRMEKSRVSNLIVRSSSQFRRSATVQNFRESNILSSHRPLRSIKVFQIGSDNPLKDLYTSGEGTSNFLVTWSANHRASASMQIMETIDRFNGFVQHAQITPTFHVLDGGGDRVATLCLSQPPGESQHLSDHAMLG